MNEHITERACTDEAEAALKHAQLVAACFVPSARWHETVREAGRLGAHPLDLALGEGVLDETDFLQALKAICGARLMLVPPLPRGPVRADEVIAFQGYESSEGRVICPNGAQADQLLRRAHTSASAHSGASAQLILTTRQALLNRALEADGARLARKAVSDLPEALSARRWAPLWAKAGQHLPTLALGGAAGLAALLWLAPTATLVLPPLVLSPLFVLAAIAVLTATLESRLPPRASPPAERTKLPRYSVLVPLHREAGIVPKLVERLNGLLYPRDRLEILFLVEEDDSETLRALEATKTPACMLTLRLPPGEPRTKPRALNLGLAVARGDLVVVYDAEDAPDPDQLLRASALFHALPARVACLQGRLSISNHADCFLTRRFAVEYAALFDCVKAGMGRAGWPVPLGGTSNHFRAGLLRRVGGWDAWNVTEDADLGLRLARLGYLVEDLPSTTWEEAPNALNAWMNQRTRWLKGWMQTLMVHLSAPHAALRALGPFRFMTIAAIGLSVVLGALFYPLFLVGIAFRFTFSRPLGGEGGLISLADAVLVLSLGLSLLVEVIPAVVALRRRAALRLLVWVPFAPLTHLLVSWAAWRGLADLLRRPFFWHKTDHGKARNLTNLGAITPKFKNKAKKRRA